MNYSFFRCTIAITIIIYYNYIQLYNYYYCTYYLRIIIIVKITTVLFNGENYEGVLQFQQESVY